jgi:hypothetical protein
VVGHGGRMHSPTLSSSTIKGAFATLVQYGLASPTWPGLRRPVSSAATSHVCAPEPNELGANENMFVRKTGNK